MQDKTLYVDMDNVLVDFQSGLNGLSAATLREYQGHDDDIPNSFSRMAPTTGSIRGTLDHKRGNNDEFTPFIRRDYLIQADHTSW